MLMHCILMIMISSLNLIDLGWQPANMVQEGLTAVCQKWAAAMMKCTAAAATSGLRVNPSFVCHTLQL